MDSNINCDSDHKIIVQKEKPAGESPRTTVSCGGNRLLSLTGMLLASSRKILRRMVRVTWKFTTTSLFYGMMVHISILQAKTLLCHLCQQYMKKIRPAHFWIILGLLTVMFALLNTQLIKCVKSKMYMARHKPKKSRHIYEENCIAKTTRSGCIYGWM